MKFHKYSSLENTYRGKTIGAIQKQVHPDTVWVAQEKVHGENFSFWVDNDRKLTVRSASRTQFVDECFYNCGSVIERHTKAARELAKEHLDGHDGRDLEAVAIFGELCGGSGNDFSQIQKDVFYHHEQRFVVFDIMLKWKSGEVTYLGVQDVMMSCLQHGFEMVPLLGSGSLDEMLDMSPEFESHIPGMYGIDAPKDNFAEGLVIRPKQEIVLGNGKRAVLKQKAKAFSEKKNTTVKKPVVLSDEANKHLDQFAGYLLNENRLAAVKSKLGEVDHTMTGKIIGLMTKDALDDYIKDVEVDPSKELDKAEWKKVVKTLTPDLAQMILKEF